MKKLIISLLMLFSVSANAAFFPEGPSITVGPRKLTDLANLIILYAYNASATAYGTFRLANGTAGYQTAAAGGLFICAVQFQNNTTAAGPTRFNIGYGDTDTGFSGAAPTSPIRFFGVAADTGLFGATDGNANPPQGYSINFKVLQNKYFFFEGTGAQPSTAIAYGYEAHDCTK